LSRISREEEIAKHVAEQFPEIKIDLALANRIGMVSSLDYLPALAVYLRDAEGFDHVTSVTGIDYPDRNLVTVTYHLGSYAKLSTRRVVLSVSVDLPRQDPKMPSLFAVWPSAEYHERETHEMLGVMFQDHPNLNLLLLPEDWTGLPPLRKDFKLRGR
jgi:NADH-quinone oxidoreductase subunit C